MRILILLSILLTSSLSAQIDVRFEKVLHDFGEIFENGGEVHAQFKVFNQGEKTVKFISIEPSCGCTAVLTEDPEVKPGEHSFINLQYNPKDRPGLFFKSVEVVMSDGKDRLTVFLGIRGTVIEEVASSQQQKTEIIQLEIPSFKVPFRTSFDTAWFELKSFTRWLNAVTYELDKTGFLYLNLEFSYSEEDKYHHFLNRKIKSRIKREMRKRGYPDHVVLFNDTIVLQTHMDKWKLGEVKLSSAQFNNDSIRQPVVEKKDVVKVSENNMRDAFYYFGATPGSLKNYFKKEALNLTTQINRKLRESGPSELVITYTYPLPWGRKDAENHFGKKSKKFLKTMDKYITRRKNLTVSTSFYKFSGDSVGVYFTWFPEKVELEKPFYIDFQREKIPSILLPDFKDHLPEEAFRLDTANRSFKRMIENLKKTITVQPQKYAVYIQSVADARPNRNYSDRSYLARKRGQKVSDDLLNYLEYHDMVDSLFQGIHVLPWVRGHDQDTKFWNHSPQKNNYVTVVPVLTPDDLPKKLLPYKVNIEQAFLEIDNSSPFYNAFVDGLVEIINMKGFAEVIIESSSSKVIIKNGPEPQVCSVLRGESMIENLNFSLIKRGISPSRLLVKEVNHVVDGPVYKGVYNKDKFFPFEYIKIIPVHQ